MCVCVRACVRACVRVCSLLCVCTLDGLNTEHKFQVSQIPSMGHHTYDYYDIIDQ